MINVYKLKTTYSEVHYTYIVHDDIKDNVGLGDSIPESLKYIDKGINNINSVPDVMSRYETYMEFSDFNELRDHFIEEFI